MFKILSLTLAVLLFGAHSAFAQEQVLVADSGNTAWLLFSSALVMLMTPGLAFFYAGMVNRKNGEQF
jgi:Amt family ammonium transporter